MDLFLQRRLTVTLTLLLNFGPLPQIEPRPPPNTVVTWSIHTLLISEKAYAPFALNCRYLLIFALFLIIFKGLNPYNLFFQWQSFSVINWGNFCNEKVVLCFLLGLFLNDIKFTFDGVSVHFLWWVVEGMALEAQLLQLNMQFLPFFYFSHLVATDAWKGYQYFFPEVIFWHEQDVSLFWDNFHRRLPLFSFEHYFFNPDYFFLLCNCQRNSMLFSI